MTNVYFSSDWHIGHKNINKFRRLVCSDEDNEQKIIDSCKVLRKRDTLFLLGDICFTEDSLAFIKNLPACRKILVKGNHDLVDTRKLLEVFDNVEGHIRYKGYWLNHCPIHPDELRGKKCIHGHVHYATLPDNRYLNLSPERSWVEYGSYLTTLQQVRKYFEDQPKEIPYE
jgi:calcineurin-like phosphoesterase family protein